jgi:hypothetical protein
MSQMNQPATRLPKWAMSALSPIARPPEEFHRYVGGEEERINVASSHCSNGKFIVARNNSIPGSFR